MTSPMQATMWPRPRAWGPELLSHTHFLSLHCCLNQVNMGCTAALKWEKLNKDIRCKDSHCAALRRVHRTADDAHV